jgi:hypothetical protein
VDRERGGGDRRRRPGQRPPPRWGGGRRGYGWTVIQAVKPGPAQVGGAGEQDVRGTEARVGPRHEQRAGERLDGHLREAVVAEARRRERVRVVHVRHAPCPQRSAEKCLISATCRWGGTAVRCSTPVPGTAARSRDARIPGVGLRPVTSLHRRSLALYWIAGRLPTPRSHDADPLGPNPRTAELGRGAQSSLSAPRCRSCLRDAPPARSRREAAQSLARTPDRTLGVRH